MLLRTESPPDVGSTLDIEVLLSDGMRLLQARGETLWSGVTGAGDKEKGAVVRFRDLDEASRTLIAKIVDQRRRDGAEVFEFAGLRRKRKVRARDLKLPTAVAFAQEPAPSRTSGNGIFDLQEGPSPTSPAGADESPPVGVQAPSVGRKPVAPVPLFDDHEPLAIDLEPEGVDLGPEAISTAEEVAAAGLQFETAAEVAPGEPETAASTSEVDGLFEDDGPAATAQPGGTEAFPPGFVDEVEAELEVVEETEPPAAAEQIRVESAAEEEAVEMAEEPPPAADEAPPPVASEPIFAEARPPLTREEAPPPPPTVSLAPEAFSAEERPPAGEETPPVTAPDEDVDPQSIPEAGPSGPADTPPGEFVPEAPRSVAPEEEMPTSAEALRGAAAQSRHLGTWLLIALLVGALGVAGYYLWGLVEAGGSVSGPETTADAPEPTAVAEEVSDEPPSEAAPVVEVGQEGLPELTEAGPTGVEDEAPQSAMEEAAAAPEPAVAAPEPAAPFTGIDRITWSETDSETVLALVADGEISRQGVDVSSIGGARPRVVVKILDVQRPLDPATVEVATAHVQRVRTALHDNYELHVVVDLASVDVGVLELATRGSLLELRLGPE
jgi:hypothetical protein